MISEYTVLSRRMISEPKTRSHLQASGQALVEMAIGMAVLALLLAAAVDLGMAYRTYQTLISASAEASSHLAYNPRVGTSSTAMDIADANARESFRNEQGTMLRRLASTRDLDANGVDDRSQSGFNLAQWIRIDEADSNQVAAARGRDDFGATFNPGATVSDCVGRKKFGPGGPCFIVVRTKMVYRPFFLTPILGTEMEFNTISVKPILKEP